MRIDEIVGRKSSLSPEKAWEIVDKAFPVQRNYLVSLVRSFRDRKHDYIFKYVIGVSQAARVYQNEVIEFGVRQGLLYEDHKDGIIVYRLNERGKNLILYPEAPNIF